MDVTQPFLDPLIELTTCLQGWFADTSNVALLSQMGITVPNVGITGFNQREQALNQGPGQANRVLLIPGSWPDGSNQGQLVPPRRRKGIFERVNATWERIVTCSVWAADTTDLHNPQLQIQAVSSLLNTVHAALREILAADFPGIGDVFRDPKTSANQSFGMELLFQFVFYAEMRGMPVNVSGTPVTPVIAKPE